MKQILPLRSMGKSDLMITPVGLGCWQFSKQKNMAGKFWPEMEDDLIEKMVRISLESGINWFDTAEIYGNGASEKALAASLRNIGKKPGEIIVATKWWPMFRFASNIPETINQRIEALAPYPIDRKYSSQFKPAGLEKSRPVVKSVQELAIKYGVTPSQIALNWLINSHGETVVAIPGATKESHAKENTGTMTFTLTAEDLSLLDKKSALFR